MNKHMNMHMFVRMGVHMRPYASEMEDDLPPFIVHIGRLLAVHLNLKRTDIPTKGHTDGRTYVRTDLLIEM